MVSKVAVMAIVGILAVPILLGYAFNLEQVTETDYKTTGDSVNVTQLLQTGTDYTYSHVDSYKLNTDFTSSSNVNVLPIYTTSAVKTSFTMQKVTYAAGTFPTFGNYGTLFSTVKNYIYYQSNDVASGTHLTLIVTNEDTQQNVLYVLRLHTFYYNAANPTLLEYSYYTNDTISVINYTSFTVDPSYTFRVTGDVNTYQGTGYFERDRGGENTYADISAGYTFNYGYYPGFLGEDYEDYSINFPNYTRNAILTIDLDSITDPNYSFGIGTQCYIEKTTTGGDVSWQVKPRPRISDNIVPVTDLYYDPNGSNTYQVRIWMDPNGEPSDLPGYYIYKQHYEFRYVGDWPVTIGEANYYQSFDIIANKIAQTPNFNSILIGGFSDYSPRIRVDDAEFRAMEYNVILDKTYKPASFKTNPATTINDPVIYGSSITFGGNTYAVSKGNITMGSHEIPVKGLVLSSVPNPDGGYDNKIGNTVVSTTPIPSTIIFNGKWSASISTIAQEEYQVTKTEWKAGDFAWDGMDQNFLMVGLLASLGAFIALGIYARRSKATIWPLLIVCGGAALLFFIML